MRRLTPLVVVAATSFLAGCSSKPAPWAKAFGDTEEQTEIHVAATPAGDLALTGSFGGTIDFGGKPLSDGFMSDADIFVAGLDAAGAHRYSRATGGLGLQAGHGAAVDAQGNAYFVGTFSGQIDFGSGPIQGLGQDIWVTRFDPTGKLAWAKHFSADDGGPSGNGNSMPAAGIAVGGDGGVVIGGFFDGTLGFGGPPIDAAPETDSAFVAKLDANGGPVFALAFGGGGHQASAVAADPQGNVAVAGSNTGVISAGSDSFTASDLNQRAWAARLDRAGAPLFLVQAGGDGSSEARGVAMDADGNVFVVGCFSSSIGFGAGGPHADASTANGYDGFLAKLSPAGDALWLRTYAGGCVTAVAADDGGHVHIAGLYTGSPDFGGGPIAASASGSSFTLELDGDGGFVAALGLPSKGSSYVISLAPTNDGLVIAGSFEGSLGIGDGTLTAAGGSDLFVARLTR